MKKNILFACFIIPYFIFAIFPLLAFNWPVEPVILTSNFCESRKDHFHTGIDIGGGAKNVYPIASGNVIFMHRTGDYASLPIGLGNFTVIQHRENIRSIYCHLEDGTVKEQKHVEEKTQIGVIGDTGHSLGKHLHLSIIDLETNTYLNPLSVLPSLKDDQAPLIRRIYVKEGNSDKLKEVGSRIKIRGNSLQLFAEIYDLREDVSFIWKMAPYSVILYKNGKAVYRVSFDSLSREGRKMVITGTNLDFDSIYRSDWIYNLGLLQLPAGETHISVVASDFNGNETSRDLFITVEQ